MTWTARILAAVFALSFWSATGHAVERYDYCKMFDTGATLFLIDRSDVYDEIDTDILSSGASEVFEGLAPGERLIVHTITDDFATSHKLFDGCVPGCPESGFIDSLLGTCREAIVRRDALSFKNRYAQRLREVLDTIEEHKGSAIIETVAKLADQYSNDHLVRMIVFSDLVENSKFGNFLKLSAGQLRAAFTKAQEVTLVPNLSGVEVTVFGFGRTHGESRKGLPPEVNARIEGFWRDYFAKASSQEPIIQQRFD